MPSLALILTISSLPFFHTEQVVELHHHAINLRAGQVNFVNHGNDEQIVLHSEENIANGLGFNPLRRIDEEQRPFTRGETARDLIRKIDMTRRIDEIEFVNLTIWRRVIHANGVRFDGNTPLAFEVHAVEHLILHLKFAQRLRLLEQPISQGRFSVINMRDNGKISNILKIHIFVL